jgi:hypothetical protein
MLLKSAFLRSKGKRELLGKLLPYALMLPTRKEGVVMTPKDEALFEKEMRDSL